MRFQYTPRSPKSLVSREHPMLAFADRLQLHFSLIQIVFLELFARNLQI
jgi:hypothetical protein